MGIKGYVLKRLDQGETDVTVLCRQARIQFADIRVGRSYVRKIKLNGRRLSLAPRRNRLSDFWCYPSDAASLLSRFRLSTKLAMRSKRATISSKSAATSRSSMVTVVHRTMFTNQGIHLIFQIRSPLLTPDRFPHAW
jgi:hypothetical protein